MKNKIHYLWMVVALLGIAVAAIAAWEIHLMPERWPKPTEPPEENHKQYYWYKHEPPGLGWLYCVEVDTATHRVRRYRIWLDDQSVDLEQFFGPQVLKLYYYNNDTEKVDMKRLSRKVEKWPVRKPPEKQPAHQE